MKVREVYMRSAFCIYPAGSLESTLAVFTHVEFCETLDNSVLIDFFLGWDVLLLFLLLSLLIVLTIIFRVSF